MNVQISITDAGYIPSTFSGQNFGSVKGSFAPRYRCERFVYLLQSIEKSPQAEYNIAQIPENKARNRFANIFPCEWITIAVIISDPLQTEHMHTTMSTVSRRLQSSGPKETARKGKLWLH